MINENIKKIIDGRQYTNLQILNALRDYFLSYPDIRFGQALANLNIIEYDHSKLSPEVIDPFYDESIEILKRVNDTLEKIKK